MHLVVLKTIKPLEGVLMYSTCTSETTIPPFTATHCIIHHKAAQNTATFCTVYFTIHNE